MSAPILHTRVTEGEGEVTVRASIETLQTAAGNYNGERPKIGPGLAKRLLGVDLLRVGINCGQF